MFSNQSVCYLYAVDTNASFASIGIMHEQAHGARNILATNLRLFRKERGISQEGLAALSGLHRTFVGAVERRERNISLDNIERLAHALNVSISDLMAEGKR